MQLAGCAGWVTLSQSTVFLVSVPTQTHAHQVLHRLFQYKLAEHALSSLPPQFFGFKLDSCIVPGSAQLCPPGLTWRDCPQHFDCYVPCNSSVAFQWYLVPGSPYGGSAYCEMFPRMPSDAIPPPLPPTPPSPPTTPPAAPSSLNATSYPIASSLSLPPDASSEQQFQFWAQVGSSSNYQPNWDDIYQVKGG